VNSKRRATPLRKGSLQHMEVAPRSMPSEQQKQPSIAQACVTKKPRGSANLLQKKKAGCQPRSGWGLYRGKDHGPTQLATTASSAMREIYWSRTWLRTTALLHFDILPDN